ncbi:MAG: SHOCT domain-containing protein [Flavobacterium sp.]|nr:SHOCT domain-containing protein [Flavobacterium sp.]
MYNDGYHFWGMHLFWWSGFILLFFWVFALRFDIPGQRNKPDSPLDELKKHYAGGLINTKTFKEAKAKLVHASTNN